MNREDLLNHDYCKKLTMLEMDKNYEALRNGYIYIYDIAYSAGDHQRDALFLKELADAMIGISAVIEVAARQNMDIHPNYVREKLIHSKRLIDATLDYYNTKKKEINDEEN